mmetsp:Transcript_14500/g.26274  ORF Transcript_14500/g.26274 Transcript_14500/m.26274 type:complete len:202 (+) Transcript_14500:156-761(+)
MGKHDTHFNTNNTLSHENMTNRGIGIHLSSMTRLDHVSVMKLHCLGTLSTKFTSHNYFTSLGRRFHDKTDHTITGTTDGKSTEQLEFERFRLRLSTETTVLHALGIEFHSAVGKVKSLLHDARQFSNALSLFAQDILSASGANDNFGTMRCGADFDASVAIFGQFASQEFIEFGIKDSVGNKLAFGRKATTACSRHDKECV